MNKDNDKFVICWVVTQAEKLCIKVLMFILIYLNGMLLEVAIYKKPRLMVVFLYNQTLYR
jgi:hypothetical protein